MASPELQRIIDSLRGQRTNRAVSVQEMRAAMDNMAFRVSADIKLEPTKAGGVNAEWVSAPGASRDRVILYLHGGGYVGGSLKTHRELVGRLSRASGAYGLALDYRLAPENPFPAAVEDAVAGYQSLLDQGIPPGRIVIAGDSAGGGLTVAALVAAREARVAMPAAAVCISPWTDLAATGESIKTKASIDPMVSGNALLPMAKHYIGERDLRTPLASPLYADLRGLPPMLIHVGAAEVLLDDSTRLAERARSAGVDVKIEVWDDMIHVWHVFAPLLPEGQRAIDVVGKFVRDRTA
jgi:monoterpene epsilon-lactone hydrolase